MNASLVLFLHVDAMLSLVLPIEELNTQIVILLAVAFLEIGLKLSFDRRMPKFHKACMFRQTLLIKMYDGAMIMQIMSS